MRRRINCEALIELFLYALPVYLPFFQTLLLHGIARTLAAVILALLLMFLVSRAADFGKLLSAIVGGFGACLQALEQPIIRSYPGHENLKASTRNLRPALLQRPPPLFA